MLTLHVDIDGACGPEVEARLRAAVLQAARDSVPNAVVRLAGQGDTDPASTVRAYLDAMERRDLKAAQGYLADGFSMQFPGTDSMSTLEELIAWSRDRYLRVSKTYQGFEVLAVKGTSVVYARGTLQGVWPDGRAFSGIRFIDRFELKDGEIVRQEVWNDLAEVKDKA